MGQIYVPATVSLIGLSAITKLGTRKKVKKALTNILVSFSTARTPTLTRPKW